MKTDTYRELLKKYWGYDDFRGIQREIIESIGAGHDTLGLMPTGGGKSITFQVPALAMEGVCIVVTPLVALMKDQVTHLKQRGIRAAAIHSGLSHSDIIAILENAVFGAVRLLYVSPERLSSQLFLTKLRHMKVSFITVDEAHCICQWGYDFRPAYLNIALIRHAVPNVPILALTASATPEVVEDIQERLEFRKPNVFRMSFERKNLAYIVRKTLDKRGELVHILSCVDGSAIVYANSRQRTKEISELLNAAGMKATYFHAGLDNAVKDARQKAWQSGDTRIIVATNAFGMGIDKPDVRVVVHIDCPSSIEAYFQEAGRAGRDGKKAYAVLLYANNDRALLAKRVAEAFPEKDYIRDVYEHLAYFFQVGVGSGCGKTFVFDINQFCRTFRFFPIQVESALNILDRAGYIEYKEQQDNQARAMFILQRDDLYRLKGNSPEEDRVIVTMLRNYSGLFSDYAYINESFIAQQAGMSTPEVYNCLKSLRQKRILSFIPQQSTPTIRYAQSREDPDQLRFPNEVYKERKEQFALRINEMAAYVASEDTCRNRMLLRYFGEKVTHNCEQCDVCLEHRGKVATKQHLQEAEKAILEMLADGQRHHVTELSKIKLPSKAVDEALRNLLCEERIEQKDGMLFV